MRKTLIISIVALAATFSMVFLVTASPVLAESGEEIEEVYAEQSSAMDVEGEVLAEFPPAGSNEEQPETAEGVEELDLSTIEVQRTTSASIETWVEQPNLRIAGQNRFETAVEISRHGYPNGASTALIVTGRDFPDALSAAALGAKLNAPLLLSETNSIPQQTAAELLRLKPSKIVIIGGSGVIGPQVERQLAEYNAEVFRVAGSNRYETSVEIARTGWQTSEEVFVATGADFADALSAGAAAGEIGAPVLLVPGTAATAPAAVRELLNDLGVTTVHIAGGHGVVTSRLESSLAASGREIVRYSGATRYETSAMITERIFDGSRNTYLATGTDFADALAGAAVAGAVGSPMLLVASTCIPHQIYTANDRVTSGQTILIGGEGVLSDEVLIGNECMAQPKGSTVAEWQGTQKLYTMLNKARYQEGLSAFRLADVDYGTPAINWSRSFGSGSAKINPLLAGQHPWAVYQTVSQTNTSGDKATRLGQLILSETESRSWLLKPSGGVRGVYSVGYTVGGVNGYATVFVGSSLK